MPVKKNSPKVQSHLGIKKQDVPPPLLKFSFRLFDATDPEVCPADFPSGYVQGLMDRLKSLSAWTVTEFITPKGKSVRNHLIDWADTARPDGFKHLNEQFSAYPAYQFSVTANHYGRVHGIMIDDTFHVCWLDQGHKVYP